MNTLATTLAAFALALPLAFASCGAPVAQEEGNCVGARQAQPLVEQGDVLSLDEAMRRAGIHTKPSSVQLCDVDSSPHWLVNLMDEYGDAERIVLNAQGN